MDWDRPPADGSGLAACRWFGIGRLLMVQDQPPMDGLGSATCRQLFKSGPLMIVQDLPHADGSGLAACQWFGTGHPPNCSIEILQWFYFGNVL
jgi:uncharacterized protein YodC (DUF2158 family)